jgi:hypothetical protein
MCSISDFCSIGNDCRALFRSTTRAGSGLKVDALPMNSADGDVHA